MKNIFLLFIVALLFGSCATSPSSMIPEAFNKNSPQGMIVGTIAFKNEKPILNGYFFHYMGKNDKKISSNKMVTIMPKQMTKMAFNPDFFDADKAVYYFSVTETPGDYQFKTLRLHANGGFVQSEAKIPMEVDFSIESGKVKYLGEIYFDYNEGVSFSNQSERDLPKLKEKFPLLTIE